MLNSQLLPAKSIRFSPQVNFLVLSSPSLTFYHPSKNEEHLKPHSLLSSGLGADTPALLIYCHARFPSLPLLTLQQASD